MKHMLEITKNRTESLSAQTLVKAEFLQFVLSEVR